MPLPLHPPAHMPTDCLSKRISPCLSPCLGTCLCPCLCPCLCLYVCRCPCLLPPLRPDAPLPSPREGGCTPARPWRRAPPPGWGRGCGPPAAAARPGHIGGPFGGAGLLQRPVIYHIAARAPVKGLGRRLPHCKQPRRLPPAPHTVDGARAWGPGAGSRDFETCPRAHSGASAM
jgi:hypothetical protein